VFILGQVNREGRGQYRAAIGVYPRLGRNDDRIERVTIGTAKDAVGTNIHAP
jgi:hypothetical protein